jgi:hypothetical protein
MTEIELLVPYSPDVFYQLDTNTYLLPICENEVLPKGKYAIIPYFPIVPLSLPVEIFEVRTVTSLVGFIFRPSLPTIHYSTGLLIYSGAWRERTNEIKFDPSSFYLVFKHTKFFVHNATNKCTLISSPKLATAIENVLTAV